MSDQKSKGISRRDILKGTAAAAGIATVSSFVPTRFAIGGSAKVKVGILLPYTGTYAKLGSNIKDALQLRIEEAGGKLGGRDVEYVNIDSEAKPPKASELTNKLLKKEKVDFLIGPVHSVVGMAMVKLAHKADVIAIIPNAGANQLTDDLCSPNVFRTSFSSHQIGYPAGPAMLEDGHKNVVLMYWNYGFGKQVTAAFRQSFEAGGGTIVKDIPTPFPKVEFQAYLTKLAAIKPDAIFTFYAGGGAVKFVKDYYAAGLHKSIPLYGAGFITEGVTGAQGVAAEGIRSTLHYADSLALPANLKFRALFESKTGRSADVYAVQGYDTGDLLLQGMAAVAGDVGAKPEMIKAMENATIDSPRGSFTFSKSHNPIQSIYLREVVNGQNNVLRTVQWAVEDPAENCKLA